jgi:hypothetical protein
MTSPLLATRARELRRTGSSYRLIAAELGISPGMAKTLTRGVVVESETLFDVRGDRVPKWTDARRPRRQIVVML